MAMRNTDGARAGGSAVKVTFEVMRCQKCGSSWKLPLTRAEVDQIIIAHKSRCDGAPAPREFWQ